MWSFISNFATLSAGAVSAATPAAAAGGGNSSPSPAHVGNRAMSPQQVSQPVVVSLTAATLKQVNGIIPRSNSRSCMSQAFDMLSDYSGVSDCDMLSDYDFELIDSNVSDWVEIRKSSDAFKDGVSHPTKKKPLYSAVAKTSSALAAPRAKQRQQSVPIVSTPAIAPKNARKRHKQARGRKYKNRLRELEISQAQRLGNNIA